MARFYTLTPGPQFHSLSQTKSPSPRTHRKYDGRLLSPNSVTSGNNMFKRRAPPGSRKPPPFSQRNGLLIAYGKQCVMSRRPSRCSLSSKAEDEQRGEEEGDTNIVLDEQTPCSGVSRREVRERAQSSVGRRRVQVMSVDRPSTAPALSQTGQGREIQPRPETPRCRLMWRTRESDHRHLDSPDSTSGGTPVLHLYLPSFQLPHAAHETAEEEEEYGSSDVNMRSDTKTDTRRDNTTHTSQGDFTEHEGREGVTAEGWNESKESDQCENNGASEGCDSRRGEESEIGENEGQGGFTEDNGRLNVAEDDAPQDVTEGGGKQNRRDELTEDKRQREVTQGDITEGEENKQQDIREDPGLNDCTEDVKQLDITKELDLEQSSTEESRQRGFAGNNGSDDTVDDIKGGSEMEPDLEMTTLQRGSDHEQPINAETKLSRDHSPAHKGHQQVLERRQKALPTTLKSGRASRSLDPRRIMHPASVILPPSPFTHTQSSPLPHMLPSFYGTSFGYRLRTLHTPRPHRTTAVCPDKRVVKPMKELPRSEESRRNPSKMEDRRITGSRLEIMSSEWGAPPRKIKTTKTFVWGPQGPQETRSVCELAGVMERRSESRGPWGSVGSCPLQTNEEGRKKTQ